MLMLSVSTPQSCHVCCLQAGSGYPAVSSWTFGVLQGFVQKESTACLLRFFYSLQVHL